VRLGLDGTGLCQVSHRRAVPSINAATKLAQSHGLLDLEITATATSHIDDHSHQRRRGHRVGQALAQALGSRQASVRTI